MPAPLAPPLSLLAPVPEALPEAPPQSFCAHFASLGLRPVQPAFALFVRDLPEFVGVPAELMWSEVDLPDVAELLLLLVLPMLSLLLPADGLAFAAPVVPLYEPPVELDVDPFMEPDVDPFIELAVPLVLVSFEDVPVVPPDEYELPVLPVVLELVEDGLLLCVAVALSLDFLAFMSPIASAEPLASAMMEVRTNAGASLRIMPPMVAMDWWLLAESSLQAPCHALMRSIKGQLGSA